MNLNGSGHGLVAKRKIQSLATNNRSDVYESKRSTNNPTLALNTMLHMLKANENPKRINLN